MWNGDVGAIVSSRCYVLYSEGNHDVVPEIKLERILAGRPYARYIVIVT